MKEKMLEFVIKRLGTKINDLRENADVGGEIVEHISDDIDVYFTTLKELLKEVVL